MTTPSRILRGALVQFRHDPFAGPAADALIVEEDGAVVLADGKIARVGNYNALRSSLPADIPEDDLRGCLIGPGFIDAHVHYPQLRVVASFGEQLLAWLENYVFPEELRFSDRMYAQDVARRFLEALLRNGTTTAAVYCTVHPESVEAFFSESARRNTRMIAGKVLMDRNAPAALLDTPQRGYDESRDLIARWHGRGRQLYAVTPRFAPTSSAEQLALAGALLDDADGLYMQTHLLENDAEEAWVRTLFPEHGSYLDVYAKAGLARPRAIFGHGVHLTERDRHHCHSAGCTIAHCPRSNLFLGSGHFDLFAALDPARPLRVALGSDLAGGDSLSMLQVGNEAYKVAHALGNRLHPAQAYWLATTGAARALELQRWVGSLEPGMEADLCVLDPTATPLVHERCKHAGSWNDVLFALMMLGDDRHVRATYVAGERVISGVS